jgi:hypothetical protein
LLLAHLRNGAGETQPLRLRVAAATYHQVPVGSASPPQSGQARLGVSAQAGVWRRW